MYIHVKVQAGAKSESFEKIKEDHFELRVKEPAERNLANKRVLEIVKNHFSESKRVRIVSGHQSPSKLISVDFDEN